MKPFVTSLAAAWLLAAPAFAADPAVPPPETALPPVPATTKDTPQKPLVLKIAVNDIYCTKTACSCISEIATRNYDHLLADLKDKHHITLRFTYFMEVFDLQKAVSANQFDGFICKPWTVLQLPNKIGADFKREADLRDPQDQPLAMLAAKGNKPATQVTYSSCGENISALLEGKVDVAVVSSYALTASCAVDFAKPEQFRTLAETENMPLTSVLLDLRKVSPADAARLQRALLDLSGDKVPKDLTGKGFVLPLSWKPATP